MAENKTNKDQGKADWFVFGIFAKIGDIFDKLTGRGWQSASSLTTSELSERLKSLLDSEVKDLGKQGKFVPHNIKLKMQWNKFSTDSEDALRKLEYEMLAAAIDHINDKLYHTYKPLKIEVKPDYFTEGIKFLASFGEFGEDDSEAEVNITAPQLKTKDLIPEAVVTEEVSETYIADYTIGDKRKTFELKFTTNKRRVSIGRTKENDLSIEDASISKIHAALVLNPQNMLLVADTGSTNGTFINGNRIAYGRAFPLGESDKIKFGTVEVFLRRVPKPTDFATKESYEVQSAPTEAFQLSPQPTVAAALPMPNQNVENLVAVAPAIPQNKELIEAEIPKTEPAINFDKEEKSQ